MAAALGICLAGAALRLAAVPRLLGDLDSVNFARGLHGFDVFAQAPHFPGYPVLIALSQLTRALGVDNDVWALALPGIVLWPLAGMLLFAGVRRAAGQWPAFGALIVSSVAPGVAIAGGWPCSEGLGLSILCAAVGVMTLAPAWGPAAGTLAMGLMLGVRLSWWPVVAAVGVALLWRHRDQSVRLLGAGAFGVLVWLLPMLVMFDPQQLLALGQGFGHGHVFGWGGTALGDGAATLLQRGGDALWALWVVGLGGSHGGGSAVAELCVSMIAAGGFALVAASRDRDRWVAGALLVCVPYAIWLVGFQNVSKARHVLPLLPVVGALIGAGLGGSRAGRMAMPLLAVALCAISTPRALTQANHAVPAVALARWVTDTRAPEGLMIFAGQEARVFERYAPMYRVVRPDSAEVLVKETRRFAAMGVEVLVTSSAPGYERVADRVTPARSFSFPDSVRPHASELSVGRFEVAAVPQPGAVL